jgi:hypothetical protein
MVSSLLTYNLLATSLGDVTKKLVLTLHSFLPAMNDLHEPVVGDAISNTSLSTVMSFDFVAAIAVPPSLMMMLFPFVAIVVSV